MLSANRQIFAHLLKHSLQKHLRSKCAVYKKMQKKKKKWKCVMLWETQLTEVIKGAKSETIKHENNP